MGEKRLSVKAISRKNLPYFWGWIAISLLLYAYFLPMGDFSLKTGFLENVLGNTNVHFYIMLVFGSLISQVFDGPRFVPATFYSVVAALLCFATLFFLEPGMPAKVIMFIASFCIAHIYAAHVYGFFLVLSNSEKFYSMILVVILPKIIMLLKPLLFSLNFTVQTFTAIFFLILISLLFSTYSIKSHPDSLSFVETNRAPLKAYFLLPVIFIVFVLNDVIAPSTMHNMGTMMKIQSGGWYFWGVISGLVLTLILQTVFLINLYTALNLPLFF